MPTPNTRLCKGQRVAHASALGWCYEFGATAAWWRLWARWRLLTSSLRAAWRPPCLFPGLQAAAASKLEASKIKRLQKLKKSSGGVRSGPAVTGAPAGSAVASPRNALRTRGSECYVSHLGRSGAGMASLLGSAGTPGNLCGRSERSHPGSHGE